MILTIDIGNSRIKWAQWQAGVIVARGASHYEKNKAGGAFDALFSVLEKPSDVFAVCVAGDEMRKTLNAWIKKHWSLDVAFLRTVKRYENIVHSYDQPQDHGADRWAAVIAGHQCFPDSAVCVINAGTAITFDLIDKSGQHLGGYILPSYLTMHTALTGDTAKVVSRIDSLYKNKKNIPDNTSDAVNEGLHRLLQAGIRDLCQVAQRKVGAPMQIILTGGFAKNIMSYPDMPPMHQKPDLVMQGVYTVMFNTEGCSDS